MHSGVGQNENDYLHWGASVYFYGPFMITQLGGGSPVSNGGVI